MSESVVTGPPDFVGVGTQRSGTTWWQRLLKDHPDIRTPRNRKKEQHFFDRFGKRPMKDGDVAAYHDLFPRKEGQLAGEWTPRYMRDVWGPRVLARAAPDAKLLVMFRDPVERYRSGVLHSSARKAGRKMTWLSTDAVERGRYADQLKRVYDYFDEQQVLVLQYERCIAEALEQYRRTLDFIGAADHVPAEITRTRGTPTRSRREPIWDDLAIALTREFEEQVAELAELVPDLDLSLWKNFAHLADGTPRREPADRAVRVPVEGGAGRPPDFIGVGTSQAGCGWWHRLLLEHPRIGRPQAGRSLEFFGDFCGREMTGEDVAGYHANFAGETDELVGEWTPDYMYQAWTPMLMHRAAPDAKLLVMLVDPMARYCADLTRSRKADDRAEVDFLANSPAKGRYTLQLRRLLEFYDRDQVLVLQLERCLQDPAAEYARTLRFLGVDDGFVPESLRDGPLARARRMLGRADEAAKPPRPRRLPLWPDLEEPMVKYLSADIRQLRELVPDLDLSLWRDFASLAEREPAAEPSPA